MAELGEDDEPKTRLEEIEYEIKELDMSYGRLNGVRKVLELILEELKELRSQ